MKESTDFNIPNKVYQHDSLEVLGHNDYIRINNQLDLLNKQIESFEIKNGMPISQDELQIEINKLGLDMEKFLRREIKDPEIIKIDNETSSTVLGLIRKFFGSDNNVKFNLPKFAVLTMVLFLKFNGAHAFNSNDSDKIDDNIKNNIKIESGNQKVNNFDNDNIYKLGIEDSNVAGEKIKISATDYFDTDKHELKNAEQLSEEFDRFFASINEDNFNKVINQDWVFKGSSDERERPLGNEKLTQDRIDSFAKLFKERMNNFDFSQKLSKEKVDKILNKKIIESYPKNGKEKGVTYPTDLVNPNTNLNYTEFEIESIKKNNPNEYQKLLDKCRYTNFEISFDIFDISTYDECIILADDSPSMGLTQKNMGSKLKSLEENKPVTIGYFSDKLTKIEKTNNSKEASEVLSKMSTGGSLSEKALSSAIEYLEKVKNEDGGEKIENGEKISSKIMYIATDESIQDANRIKDLLKIAEETNTHIKFLVFYEKGTKVIKLDIDEFNNMVDKITNNKINVEKVKKTKDLSEIQEKINETVDRLIDNFLNPIHDYTETYGALEKIGIKINHEKITNNDEGKKILKNILLDNKNYAKLMTLDGQKLFQEYVNLIFEKGKLDYSIAKTNKMTIEDEIKNSNLAVNIVKEYLEGNVDNSMLANK